MRICLLKIINGTMEDLLQKCSHLSLKDSPSSWYDNTSRSLYCIQSEHNDYVYSSINIHTGEFIGHIVGERKYTWEILPHKYCIWLNDSYVIDCRETPRCITSMIRETHDETLKHNCEIAFAYTNDTIDVYIIATSEICRGEELIIKKECMEDYY